MILESILVHIPKQFGNAPKQAVIMDYSDEQKQKRGLHRLLKVEPMFVMYNKLSEQEQGLWDSFMEMLEKNMHDKGFIQSKEQ